MSDRPVHALDLHVDPDAPEPPYVQLREEVRRRVADGALTPGTRLPPVRTLATELGLAANTVARAYRELEQLGVIETRGRAGSFVSGDEVGRAAREAAQEYADRVRALGVAPAEAVELVRRALG
ncbi:GntR family transcriptional regulator [Nocardioides guangzhouensis]|uniref:GntR family transcriptional regulator n=1 Tax=Nocardioides guangzhouensis TaxID=2497878 RepID=UPI001FE9CE99|nr:GntR family transcriptional regulator [Nocardioides guangzhouensis]